MVLIKKMSELSIIIPTKNRGKVFYKTLQATYEATEESHAEIIVINDSKTNHVVIEKKYSDRVKVFNNPKNGVAAARNYGAKISSFNRLLFLDDDTLINKSNISDLLVLSKQYPDAAINFSWVYPDELLERIKKTQFGRYLIHINYTSQKGWSKGSAWNDTALFETDAIASYFLSLSKDTFNLLGGYNESIGTEDFYLSMCIKQKGIKGLCNPLSIVFHNEEDRVTVLAWLERKKWSGILRKTAVGLGYNQMGIKTNKVKILLAKLIYSLRDFFFFILKITPNKTFFDGLYFKITDFLFSAYLYKGYFSKSQ